MCRCVYACGCVCVTSCHVCFAGSSALFASIAFVRPPKISRAKDFSVICSVIFIVVPCVVWVVNIRVDDAAVAKTCTYMITATSCINPGLLGTICEFVSTDAECVYNRKWTMCRGTLTHVNRHTALTQIFTPSITSGISCRRFYLSLVTA